MGNEVPVKYSDNEVTLEKRFKALQTILSRNKIRYIDYSVFSEIITSRFERIPRILPECLFLAFASDKSVRLDPKDFISALTIILGNDQKLIKKFVFRVYDIKLGNSWDRDNVEAILRNAYGIRSSNKGPGIDGVQTEQAKNMLDAIFSTVAVNTTRGSAGRDGRRNSRDGDRENGAKVTQYTARKRNYISAQDFQTYDGDTSILVQWIVRVLSVFVEPPSSQLLRIDRRYSNSMDTSDMMAKYNITEANCDRLRKIFHTRCGSSKAELTLDSWIDWCVGYLNPNLAASIFRAKSRTFKLIWRFVDFADFCLVLGVGSGMEKAAALCKMFFSAFNKNEQREAVQSSEDSLNANGDSDGRVESFLQCMRRMVLLLAQSYEPIESSAHHHFSANSNVYSEHMPRPSLISNRSRSTSGGGSGLGSPLSPERRPSLAVADLDDDDKYASSLEMLEDKVYLPEAVRTELSQIEETARDPAQGASLHTLLQFYVELLINHESNLPGLRELSMTACCLFGVRPSSPHLEKEYVMEIMMRRQAEFPQSRANPFGPLDTEWCIISKAWWDAWRFYVGKIRHRGNNGNSTGPIDRSAGDVIVGSPKSGADIHIPEPSAIDNRVILSQKEGKQLLHGTETGQHLEVIPPAVYASVHAWYGGGPRIIRKVVPCTRKGVSSETELELFPLNIRICTCDHAGRKRNNHRDFLFSKTALISDVTNELSAEFKIDITKVRLWNYEKPYWKDQYILSPELTLSGAGVQDNQEMLMEISSNTGSWPRSQLHSDLEEREGEADDREGEENLIASKSGKHSIRINSGRVGLDNLGNTCYLNSSMQALMHTEPLMDYFLSQTHMKHINVKNPIGHGGRLGYHFGKIATEMWGTTKMSLAPRTFFTEVGDLNPQFAGHQQQDAEELISFLFQGISEDVNLVENKAYTVAPDSDGRPDRELADIWWSNHHKRELSIIQALFAGQFKSTTVCKCGHKSDRFEPYTLLSLPVPEDSKRSIRIHVFARGVSYGVECRVSVDRNGTLEDVAEAILSPDFTPPLVGLTLPQPIFVCAEVLQSRVKSIGSLSRKLRTIMDDDNIFFFELSREASIEDDIILKGKSGVSGSASEGSNAMTSKQIALSAAKENHAGTDTDKDGSDIVSIPILPEYVRCTFVQRKARLVEGGGVDTFSMSVFGLPLMEVLPRVITGKELYKIIAARVSAYLRGSSSRIRRLAVSMEREGISSGKDRSNSKGGDDDSDHTKSANSSTQLDFSQGDVRPLEIEDAVGRSIPPTGFLLRFVMGGGKSACTCSRCPWLAKCCGCFIPNNEVQLELIDGESIAIDWHMVVFEEMIDTAAIMKVVQHATTDDSDGQKRYRRSQPLSRCLNKFMEQEALEGYVCPKCHEDDKMRKRMELWRLPPVLVVQLKRFQYDRQVRKKLTNHIEFPLEGLDMYDYLASTRKGVTSPGGTPNSTPDNKGAMGEKSTASTLSSDDDAIPLEIEEKGEDGVGCTVYDLYAVIHHVGRMEGGGHYVCTVREGRKPRNSIFGSESGSSHSNSKNSASDLSSLSGNGNTSTGSLSNMNTSNHTNKASGLSDRWLLYNDGQVTTLADLTEVSASSAYVLFYMRRDVRTANSTSDLLPSSMLDPELDRSRDFTLRKKSVGERMGLGGGKGGMFGWRGNGKQKDGTVKDEQDVASTKNDCVVS